MKKSNPSSGLVTNGRSLVLTEIFGPEKSKSVKKFQKKIKIRKKRMRPKLNKKIFLSSSPDILVKMAPLIIALFFSGQTKAQSQAHNLMDHSHPNVTVDLSVISGGSVSQYSNSVNGILPR